VPPPKVNQILSVATLPVRNQEAEIIASIQQHQVVIISGSTGSGKSTQVPQFILEQATRQNKPCSVIVALPRRLAAIGLANRVSFERSETTGGPVGYHVRFDNR